MLLLHEAPLHRCNTAPLHRCTTAPLQHCCTTAPQRHSTKHHHSSSPLDPRLLAEPDGSKASCRLPAVGRALFVRSLRRRKPSTRVSGLVSVSKGQNRPPPSSFCFLPTPPPPFNPPHTHHPPARAPPVVPQSRLLKHPTSPRLLSLPTLPLLCLSSASPLRLCCCALTPHPPFTIQAKAASFLSTPRPFL